MMDISSKINSIKALWYDTFGDTKDYIDMIIDNYYDDSRSVTLFDRSRIISSSLVIPYDFLYERHSEIHEVDTAKSLSLEKGWYLCGLATIPEERGKGLMQEIISQIEANARKNNVAFTFLIPADEKLRNYYRKLGYKDTASRVKVSLKFNICRLVNFDNTNDKFNNICSNIYALDNCRVIDKINIQLKRNIKLNLLNEKAKFLNSLIRYCRNYECQLTRHIYGKNDANNSINYENYCFDIFHSYQQWTDVISDILIEGGYIVSNIDITALDNLDDLQFTDTKEEIKYKDISSESSMYAACIVTYDNKIFPLFGGQELIIQLIGKNLGYFACEGEEFKFYISSSPTSYATVCQFNNFENYNIDWSAEYEKYGMAKIIKEEFKESSIRFDLMFD